MKKYLYAIDNGKETIILYDGDDYKEFIKAQCKGIWGKKK